MTSTSFLKKIAIKVGKNNLYLINQILDVIKVKDSISWHILIFTNEKCIITGTPFGTPITHIIIIRHYPASDVYRA